MISTIIFEIPAAFEAAVRSGVVVQIGGLLKDSATGKIVAHLQESGLAQALISKALGSATSPISLVTSVLDTGASIYTAVEVTKIKAMVAAMQSLQIATLGVSLVGVGISVAGFYYMHTRFNALDQKLDQLIDTVTSGFDRQREDALRAHMSRVRGLTKDAKHAASLSRPDKEYGRIAEALSSESAHFDGELDCLIKSKQKINVEMFWQLTQVLMLCNSIRVDCRIRTSELRNAREISESIASDYRRQFDRLTPASFQVHEGEAERIIQTLRDITDSAATKPYLIDYLRTQRYDGGAYLKRLEDEAENPILLLKAS